MAADAAVLLVARWCSCLQRRQRHRAGPVGHYRQRAYGQPVYKLLGGAVRDCVRMYARMDLGLHTHAEEVRAAEPSGFSAGRIESGLMIITESTTASRIPDSDGATYAASGWVPIASSETRSTTSLELGSHGVAESICRGSRASSLRFFWVTRTFRFFFAKRGRKFHSGGCRFDVSSCSPQAEFHSGCRAIRFHGATG